MRSWSPLSASPSTRTSELWAAAGATAYSWLASPASSGEAANRAKVLEDLIDAELRRRGAPSEPAR